MPEGLSPSEVGKEIEEHRKHLAETETKAEKDKRDRVLSIIEALLLSLVAVLAAYSGYAAAKWSTDSSVSLATASADRTKANRADIEGIITRSLDSASFNAWFTAFVAGNANDERIAVGRMRPGYRVAFDSRIATDPAHNPHAPAGPAYMPQYVIPQQAVASSYDHGADVAFADGEKWGATSDKYIRDTVFLATVLFLVGIAGHFRIRQARYGLIVISALLLAFSVYQLLGLPQPPS